MTKKLLILFLIVFLPFIYGCSLFASLGVLACEFMPDGDHCQQFIAVQSGDPSRCEKIKGKDFADVGSNPPRDKCYLMIAENTGDLSVCNNMEGGMYSYEPDDCLLDTALKHNLYDQCDQMSSYPSKYETCKSELVSLKNMSNLDQQIDDLYSKSLKKENWYNQELQNELEELKSKKDGLYNILPAKEQQEYFIQERKKMFEKIYDEDVKQGIAREFMHYRSQMDENTTISEKLKKLEEIRDTQETMKRLDEHTNTMHDEIMSALVDMAENQKKEYLDSAKEKAIQEVYKRSSNNLKSELAHLEMLKNQYDTASAYYQEITDKYNTLKDAYDGIVQIQSKLSKFDKMVDNGKLTNEKARVLKGSVLLGAGLEQVTGYVPVFGSTMSKISAETFEVVNKFATERAQRTTGLDKCIQDPANCDPDDITGY